MLHTRLFVAAFATTCMLAISAHAADPALSTSNRADGARPPMAEGRIPDEQWKKMSPEERRTVMEKRREAMRDRWEKMTPEQRAEFKKEHPRFAERQEKWDKMTPEEREKAKAEMEKRRAERHARMEARRAELEKMTPEQREKAKAEMKTRREEHRKEWQAAHPKEGAPAAGSTKATAQ